MGRGVSRGKPRGNANHVSPGPLRLNPSTISSTNEINSLFHYKQGLSDDSYKPFYNNKDYKGYETTKEHEGKQV